MSTSYTDITNRMKMAGKLKNDSAVARVLEVTPQALSNYKKRGRMPMNLVLKFATIYGLSLDWLMTGQGEPYMPGAGGEGFPMAAEETMPYGREELAKITSFANLNADEIIYVGKLLKVLRCPNKSTVTAMRCSIDAFLRATDLPPEKSPEEAKKTPEEEGTETENPVE
jgi:hypothetical protein